MRRDSDQQTRNDSLSRASNQDKNYFVKNKKSGLYQSFNPFTGQLEEQGNYSYGEPTGLWRVIDADGDEQHFQYSSERVGALCNDGSRSSATGRGACSWHGGVAQWLYSSIKRKVGGTGKYESIQSKIVRGKKIIKQKFKLNQTGEQLQYQLTLLILQLDDKNQKLQKSNLKAKTQNQKLKSDLKRTKQQLQEQKKNSATQFTKSKKENVKENSTNQKQKTLKKPYTKNHQKKKNSQEEDENSQKQNFKSILYKNQIYVDQAEQSPSQLQIRTDSDSDLQRDNDEDDKDDEDNEDDEDQDYVPEVKQKKILEKDYELRSKVKKQEKQPVKQQIHFRKAEKIMKKNKNSSSQQSDQNNEDCDLSQAVIKQLQKQLQKGKEKGK